MTNQLHDVGFLSDEIFSQLKDQLYVSQDDEDPSPFHAAIDAVPKPVAGLPRDAFYTLKSLALIAYPSDAVQRCE